MAASVPVIVTDSCGLADRIAQADAGTVVDESVEGLRRAIAELIEEPTLRLRRGSNAQQLARGTFSMSRIAADLEDIYVGRGVN